MRIELVYDFPSFDTGLFEGPAFEMSEGNASLSVKVYEHEDIILEFSRIRWHEFTALYNCSSDQVTSAYFKLVKVVDSEAVSQYVAADKASRKAYRSLHHFRVFLDEHGCHEVFAQSARGYQRSESCVEVNV